MKIKSTFGDVNVQEMNPKGGDRYIMTSSLDAVTNLSGVCANLKPGYWVFIMVPFFKSNVPGTPNCKVLQAGMVWRTESATTTVGCNNPTNYVENHVMSKLLTKDGTTINPPFPLFNEFYLQKVDWSNYLEDNSPVKILNLMTGVLKVNNLSDSNYFVIMAGRSKLVKDYDFRYYSSNLTDGTFYYGDPNVPVDKNRLWDSVKRDYVSIQTRDENYKVYLRNIPLFTNGGRMCMTTHFGLNFILGTDAEVSNSFFLAAAYLGMEIVKEYVLEDGTRGVENKFYIYIVKHTLTTGLTFVLVVDKNSSSNRTIVIDCTTCLQTNWKI